MNINKIMPSLSTLRQTTQWALEQAPIGEKGTVLPPVSGIDTDADLTYDNVLVNLQSVLSNAKHTNTGWSLDGKERDAFMEIIGTLDFNHAREADTMRAAVERLLTTLNATLEEL